MKVLKNNETPKQKGLILVVGNPYATDRLFFPNELATSDVTWLLDDAFADNKIPSHLIYSEDELDLNYATVLLNGNPETAIQILMGYNFDPDKTQVVK